MAGRAPQRDRDARAPPPISAPSGRARSAQPQSGPWEMPSAAAPIPAPSSSVPTASGRRARRGAERGTRRVPATIARPTGTLMRNSARQPTVSTSTPPIAGPAAAASAPAALHSPIAAARRSGGASISTTASDAGIIAAAAAPWSARETSSSSSVGASAQASENIVKAVTPASSSARRPTTSATPTRRGEQGGEHDRVDRDQPGGAADGGAGEVAADVGDREVRHRGVEKGEEGGAGRDEQDARSRVAARGTAAVGGGEGAVSVRDMMSPAVDKKHDRSYFCITTRTIVLLFLP